MGDAPTVWTIGYEAAGFDGVLAALRKAGIAGVIDVRDLPLSRRAGFSKRVLAASLSEAGIDYVHFKALGTPKEGRMAARRHDYARFWAIVEERMQTPAARFALETVAEIARAHRSVLLCFEADPMACHRRRVADDLAALHGFQVEHLYVGLT